MKQHIKKVVGLIITASLTTIPGCDHEDKVSPINKGELTSGTGKWKLTALSVTSEGQTEEAYANLEECTKDNIFYFKNDGKYQLLAGEYRCDLSELNVLMEGSWRLDGKKLTMEFSGVEQETVEIIVLNTTTFISSLTIDFLDESTTLKSTYTKQAQ